jgi:hypothetical protein
VKAAVAILLVASAIGGMLYFFEHYRSSDVTIVSTSNTGSSGSITSNVGSSGEIVITSANFSSTDSRLSIIVKNTGSLSLIGVQLSISPSSQYHTGGWTPNPSSTYPIYHNEIIQGTYVYFSQYRQGVQVRVLVTASFSDGSISTATDTLVVGQ